MKWITATELERWSGTHPARTELPELVKDLIRASATDIHKFRFPTGDSAQLPGWDGRLNSLGGFLYVPDGDSVWEMGTPADYLGKANGDYEKRKTSPGAVDPATTTFVFVTPRRWQRADPTIEGWINGKLAEGVWKDVRAIDGVMLEDWLDQCPAVAEL